MRLPASLRLGLYAAGAVVALSGIAWLLATYAAAERASRAFAAASLEIHGGGTIVLLVLLGSTVALHVPAGWREARNRRSGILLAAVLIVLAVTGFLLYYAGDEAARSAASVVHWLFGLAAPLALAIHGWLGRRGGLA